MYKNYFHIFISILLIFTSISCVKESDFGDVIFENNPIKDKNQVLIFENNEHQIILYAESVSLHEGYNEFYLQIIDQNNKSLSHLETKIDIINTSNYKNPPASIQISNDRPDVYRGFILIPPNTLNTTWSLNLNYSLGKQEYIAETELRIETADKFKTNTIHTIGRNNKSYICVMTDPQLPIIGVNNFILMLYEENDEDSYTALNYMNIEAWIKNDSYLQETKTRLLFQESIDRYHGKLEIPQADEWEFHILVKDLNNNIILGNEKSTNPQEGDLYFNIKTN